MLFICVHSIVHISIFYQDGVYKPVVVSVRVVLHLHNTHVHNHIVKCCGQDLILVTMALPPMGVYENTRTDI